MPYGRFSMGMSMLLTGLLSLCLTCGPSVHPATTQAIIEVESAGKPLTIHDNTTGISYNPTTKSEAVALTADLLHHGHSLDIGLMQINSQLPQGTTRPGLPPMPSRQHQEQQSRLIRWVPKSPIKASTCSLPLRYVRGISLTYL